MRYSVIIPVYNRPDEVDELLSSLTRQAFTDFEVIVVEDGSSLPCDKVCQKYADKLSLHYYTKANGGPGDSRNYGAAKAQGEWLIILDSDVLLPNDYFTEVEKGLTESPDVSAFGGPDASHPDFNVMQKAVSYSMTSFFTTGGIRGGKAKLDKFYPRSYNMGIKKDVYAKLHGFTKMRYGEDIDFSYRIVEAGYKTALLPEAWVWHKRRTDLRAFFRQVEHSGAARIALTKLHPGTLKIVHLLPAVFTVGVTLLVAIFVVGLMMSSFGSDHMNKAFGIFLCQLSMLPLALYSLIIFIDSAIKHRDLHVALLSVPASFTQLMGYGTGFIKACFGK